LKEKVQDKNESISKELDLIITETVTEAKKSNMEFEQNKFWRQEINHREIEKSRDVKELFDMEFEKLKENNIAHQLNSKFKQQRINLDLEMVRKDKIISGFVEKIKKRDEEYMGALQKFSSETESTVSKMNDQY